MTSTQVLRERATALEATVVAVDAEVEVLETALFAMPEDGRHGCVPRLFLGDAAEGVIDLSEAPEVVSAPAAPEPVEPAPVVAAQPAVAAPAAAPARDRPGGPR